MPEPTKNIVAVFDIGKTNAKFTLLDANGDTIYSSTTPNQTLSSGLYQQANTEHLWTWLLGCLHDCRNTQPEQLVVVTHGATAAVLKNETLVLPVLDYEMPLSDIDDCPRPDFAETASPDLPSGLNLGRQLFWQAKHFPKEFASANTILMYPQYWTQRLCGVAASEITSLGCHTDLWNIRDGGFSSLVTRMGWQEKFPALQPAWQRLGWLREDLKQRLGFTKPCAILCGIHDSNASLLPYLASQNCAVVSTGTWVIAMVVGGDTRRCLEARDMLANINALGQAVPTARYMGGREFAAILDAPTPNVQDWKIVEAALAHLVVPSFCDIGGPFQNQRGHILPQTPTDPVTRYGLASLYSALMIDLQLEWLGATQDVFLEGSFVQNPWIAGLVAALRPTQRVFVAHETSGTTQGAFALARWEKHQPVQAAVQVLAAPVLGLHEHKQKWRALLHV